MLGKCLALLLVACAAGAVELLRTGCAEGSQVACIMEEAFTKDSFKVSESLSVVRNQQAAEARSDAGWLQRATSYLRTHDVIMDVFGSQVKLSPRNIEQGELELKLRFDEEEEARSKLKKKIKKSKLKKILVPVAIFVLLKAMTVIPLLLGVLGVKAWNALQLSFGSFVVSLALAVFQFCQKLAHDAHPPAPQIVTAHGGWDASAARELQAAYRAYRRR